MVNIGQGLIIIGGVILGYYAMSFLLFYKQVKAKRAKVSSQVCR
jgi:hypothetical protein